MPRPTLYAGILDELGLEIASETHAPGDVLKIELLEQRFNVSRTVVRETVKVLEAIRMVKIKRRIGVTVRPIGDWNVFDPRIIRWRLAGPRRAEQLRTLTELRGAIEPAAARRTAARATEEQRTSLAALAASMRESGAAGDLSTFLQQDIEFHRRLLVGSGNEMFNALGDVVAEVLTGRTVHHLMPEHPKSEAMRLHEKVATAIVAGDGAGAENAMRALLAEVSEQVEVIESQDVSPTS